MQNFKSTRTHEDSPFAFLFSFSSILCTILRAKMSAKQHPTPTPNHARDDRPPFSSPPNDPRAPIDGDALALAARLAAAAREPRPRSSSNTIAR